MFNHDRFTLSALGFSRSTMPPHRSISARARAIWQDRSCPAGNDLAIWLQAERQLMADGHRPPLSIQQRLQDGYAPVLGRRRSATSV